MPTPIQPDKLARAAGFDPTDFVNAVQNGEDDYSGLPIGSWRQNGGEYLNVPDDYAENLGFAPEDTRSNPSLPVAESGAESQNGLASPTWPKAVEETAAPVSANAGAAYTAGKFADTVKEQPQVMEDFIDGAALLGSAGLAYATAEEGEVLKAGATAAGLFAAFKGIRYLCEQGDRQTDMDERKQRHQLQQQRQKQLPDQPKKNDPQRRLNGRNSSTSDSGVQIRGA